MKAKLFIALTIIALLALAIPSAGAQDDPDSEPVTVTFTEAEINTLITERPFPGDNQFNNTSVDLQPGQVVISTEFTRRANGAVVSMVGTLVPQYDNNGNFTDWAVASLLIDGEAPADAEASGRFSSGLFANFGDRLRDRSVQDVLNVEITDTDITYTLAMEPRSFIGELDREAGTYTITEAGLNNAEAPDRVRDRFEERPELINDVYADFQPGQVVVSGAFQPPQDEEAESILIAITIVPVIENGRVNWEITSIEAGDNISEQLSERLSEGLLNSFRQDASRAERNTGERITVTSVEITDTEIVYSLEGPNAE